MFRKYGYASRGASAILGVLGHGMPCPWSFYICEMKTSHLKGLHLRWLWPGGAGDHSPRLQAVGKETEREEPWKGDTSDACFALIRAG